MVASAVLFHRDICLCIVYFFNALFDIFAENNSFSRRILCDKWDLAIECLNVFAIKSNAQRKAIWKEEKMPARKWNERKQKRKYSNKMSYYRSNRSSVVNNGNMAGQRIW